MKTEIVEIEKRILKMLEEPKNNIGQTPFDCCVDTFFEELEVDENIVDFLDDDIRDLILSALKEAIIHWERIKAFEDVEREK